MTTTVPSAPLLEPSGARPRSSRGLEVLLLVLACLPYVIGLASPPLWDANEPLYAEPPKEALETGDWLAPPWNGRRWFVHPPLSSWLTMPSYALFGVSPFAARLPMALAALATIFATYALGRATAGRRGGLVAAIVLAATARYWLFARQLAGDVYLTACLTGAFALALRALTTAGRDGGGRLLASYALVGVGVLAKGPVIVVLFLGPLLLAARLAKPRVALRALRPYAFAVAILALGAPWFVYMGRRYGAEYYAEYFGHHHARRTFSDAVGGRPPWFYLLALLGDAQPWILFLPFAVRRAWKAREADPARLLAWFMAAFPLVLFTIPSGKRNVYLLPLYPGLAAALAPFLLEWWDGLHDRLARAGSILLAAAALVSCVLLVVGAGNAPAEIAAGSRVYLVLCALAFVAALYAVKVARGRVVVGLTAGFVWALLVASALLLPILGRFMPVPRLAASLVAHARPEDPAIVYRTGIHSLMFYANRRTSVAKDYPQLLELVPAGTRAFVLGTADAVTELRAMPDLEVEDVDRAPYFKFQFNWNIRGKGASTRDLVLVRIRRPAAGRRNAEDPGESPKAPVRSGDR